MTRFIQLTNLDSKVKCYVLINVNAIQSIEEVQNPLESNPYNNLHETKCIIHIQKNLIYYVGESYADIRKLTYG